MFRFLARFIGLWLLAGAVVAAVVDGSRSLAASRLVVTNVGQSWVQVHRPSMAAAQAAIERQVSGALWDPVITSVLALPLALILLLLATFFLLAGKPPRDILSAR